MSRSWDDVQSVLDDPFVSADTKEALLSAYVQENYDPWAGSEQFPDEVNDYLDGTKATYDISDADAMPARFGMSTDDLYTAAREESEDKGYQAGLVQDEIDENTSTLDEMVAPTTSSAGVETSDELLDLARPALRVFEDFIPANDEVPGELVGQYRRFTMDDIRTRYDEQLGISFKKFLEDAERLRAAHETLTGLNTTTETELNTVYQSWTGPAANASYQYYSTEIVPNSSDLIDFLSATPDMIVTLVENLFAEVKAKADTVMSLYSPTVGSATPEMAMKVISLAKGNIGDEDHDRILEVAAWVDSVCGTDLESRIRADDCDLNSENKAYVEQECRAWIRDSFNADLHDNLYKTFDETCRDTLEAVDSYYEELNSYLSEYENEFGEALPPQQPGPEQTGPGQPGPSTPQPGPPPSGGPSSPGGPSMPPPSAPETPGPEDAPAPEDPSALTPTTPTTPGEQETVTIDDGARSIAVTSPDGQGQVTVTVDDGSGEPKTYTLDFGEGAETPETPGPGAGGFGPQGSQAGQASQVPGQDEPIRPGPDGKCVVQDGDLTITAERPGDSTDTVVVTVDDGDGEPVTYDLDYSGEDGPAAARPLPAPGIAQPAGVGGSDPAAPAGTGTLPDPRGQFAPGREDVPVSSVAGAEPAGPGGVPDPRGAGRRRATSRAAGRAVRRHLGAGGRSRGERRVLLRPRRRGGRGGRVVRAARLE